MSAIGLALLVLAGLLMYEAVKGISSGSQTAEAASVVGNTTGSTPTSATSQPSSTVTGGPSGASVQHNVTYLATWAKTNGFDPRVVLTILAGEGAAGGGGTHVDTNGQVSTGPLQINQVNAPGGVASQAWIQSVDTIEGALSAVLNGAGSWNVLRGVSYSQFLQNPAGYYNSAQRGYYPTVAANLAASNNFSGIVNGWCQQYGVC